ncbi:CrcB protein [Williamsia sterculiae]|uniref:Fluoride-specific ion channel FluC n=2 Tax=Williamsia sterculiae TaxID=1344003 RepID=A0A1N7F5R2_9NOCA|nr:CrcB family protein [Williamsia sterculiae]SIR95575.1 CrcB protein [Williamsia sterculiae]
MNTAAPLDPDVGDVRPLHLRPSSWAAVALGGLVGTYLRYVVEEAIPHDPDGWPWGTFVINIVGAVVLGALLETLSRLGPDVGWRQRVRLVAGTGACGAFTTYSTLALEASLLTRGGHVATAVAYLAASLVLGVVAAWVGIVTAEAIHRRTTGTSG